MAHSYILLNHYQPSGFYFQQDTFIVPNFSSDRPIIMAALSRSSSEQAAKEISTAVEHELETSNNDQWRPRNRWEKIQAVIWDGIRTPEERKLVKRLDIYLLSWATFGYFIRLLDSTNISGFLLRIS